MSTDFSERSKLLARPSQISLGLRIRLRLTNGKLYSIPASLNKYAGPSQDRWPRRPRNSTRPPADPPFDAWPVHYVEFEAGGSAATQQKAGNTCHAQLQCATDGNYREMVQAQQQLVALPAAQIAAAASSIVEFGARYARRRGQYSAEECYTGARHAGRNSGSCLACRAR